MKILTMLILTMLAVFMAPMVLFANPPARVATNNTTTTVTTTTNTATQVNAVAAPVRVRSFAFVPAVRVRTRAVGVVPLRFVGVRRATRVGRVSLGFRGIRGIGVRTRGFGFRGIGVGRGVGIRRGIGRGATGFRRGIGRGFGARGRGGRGRR